MFCFYVFYTGLFWSYQNFYSLYSLSPWSILQSALMLGLTWAQTPSTDTTVLIDRMLKYISIWLTILLLSNPQKAHRNGDSKNICTYYSLWLKVVPMLLQLFAYSLSTSNDSK